MLGEDVLITGAGPIGIGVWFALMAPPRLPAPVLTRLRTALNEILQYPEDCAGSIMTMEFLSLKKDMNLLFLVAA